MRRALPCRSARWLPVARNRLRGAQVIAGENDGVVRGCIAHDREESLLCRGPMRGVLGCVRLVEDFEDLGAQGMREGADETLVDHFGSPLHGVAPSAVECSQGCWLVKCL